MKTPVYMDFHATTPCDPRVVEAMLPFFVSVFGNSASSHAFGKAAQTAVEKARGQVARLLGASPREIVFNSGATEANNQALIGVAQAYRDRGRHILTQATEHKAVLNTCRYLESQGFEVTYLEVDRYGRVDPREVKKAVRTDTILLSFMFANNEVGTLQPIEEIGALAKARGIIFHTDAAQAVGKVPIDVSNLGIDLLSLSAHKMYGPKGVGALYVRGKEPRVRLVPVIFGAGHERGLRSGTLNVSGIVGLGQAAALAESEWREEGEKLSALRNRLQEGLLAALEESFVNGHPTERLPQNLNMSFAKVDPVLLLSELKDVALSSGSSCTSTTQEPSFVLRAMGVEESLALSSLRFGLGRFTTEEEVDFTCRTVISHVRRLRKF